MHWFSNQEAIGGHGIIVEIDETLLVQRKHEKGSILNQIWLFGRIELVSKKRFIVPLCEEVGEKRDRATFEPLIKKIRSPTVRKELIYSPLFTGLFGTKVCIIGGVQDFP